MYPEDDQTNPIHVKVPQYLEVLQVAHQNEVMVAILQDEEVKADELNQWVLEIPEYVVVFQVEQSLELHLMVLMSQKLVL